MPAGRQLCGYFTSSSTQSMDLVTAFFHRRICRSRSDWSEDKRWEPTMDQSERERQMRLWKKAVTKSMDWVDDDVK